MPVSKQTTMTTAAALNMQGVTPMPRLDLQATASLPKQKGSTVSITSLFLPAMKKPLLEASGCFALRHPCEQPPF